jgi:hypothetical protein
MYVIARVLIKPRNLGCPDAKFLPRMLPHKLILRATKPSLNSFSKSKVPKCGTRCINTLAGYQMCIAMPKSTAGRLEAVNRRNFYTSFFRRQQKQEEKVPSKVDESNKPKTGTPLPLYIYKRFVNPHKIPPLQINSPPALSPLPERPINERSFFPSTPFTASLPSLIPHHRGTSPSPNKSRTNSTTRNVPWLPRP